jgi:23S rRNA (guanosine2251-2'-O)-methyltransferase
MARRKQSQGFSGPRPAASSEVGGKLWLYGRHPVEAALLNPRRGKLRFMGTKEALDDLPDAALRAPKVPPAELIDRARLESVVPAGALHQGLALLVEALPGVTLEDICAETNPDALVVALDRAHDPHNVGAVMRSAAAFGASAVIVPDRHAPEATPTLAKAASGALERVPLVRVPNIVNALKRLKESAFWVAGLAADAPQTLAEAKLSGRLVLVLGAEGAGMRRLATETCDYLVRIPMAGEMESLNMSNAAAIALYELRRGATVKLDG